MSIYDYDEEEVRMVVARDMAEEMAEEMAVELAEKMLPELAEKKANELAEKKELISKIKLVIKKVKKEKSVALIADELEELQDFIVKTGLEIQNQKQRIADFGQLEKDYAIYESNRAALEKCKKEEQRFQEKQKLAKERQAKLLEEQKTAQNTLNILEREAEKLNEKYTRYATYEKAGQYTLPEEISVEQMEARYEAITSVLSQELKDLEERETKASGRFQREQNELEHLQKKYRLKPVQWADVIYDRKEESHQEVILEDFQRKIQTKDMQWNYRKPKPLKKGAYTFAAKNHVPVLPCFITMEDSDILGDDGFYVQEYTIHIAEPIYPDPQKTQAENVDAMRRKNAAVWKQIYEEFYGIPLVYDTAEAVQYVGKPTNIA